MRIPFLAIVTLHRLFTLCDFFYAAAIPVLFSFFSLLAGLRHSLFFLQACNIALTCRTCRNPVVGHPGRPELNVGDSILTFSKKGHGGKVGGLILTRGSVVGKQCQMVPGSGTNLSQKSFLSSLAAIDGRA